ncbi:MAG: ThuA domain-containing protein [Candidatus Hydrogenedentes bacterium]|nr:ThuA domain-containing protein [Candidatus Hydrogenedentota bacterium]
MDIPYLGWQRPVERDLAEIARIVGPIEQREPSRDLNIVWVWGIDKFHPKQTHEYAWVMDRYAYDLLPHVPRVTVTPCYYFPKKELWDKADLVVFYMWPCHDGAHGFRDKIKHEEDLRNTWDYDIIDAYQNRGGGLVFLHMALQQGTGVELAKRIGLAWGHKDPSIPNTTAGVLDWPVTLTSAGRDSPILKDFPDEFKFTDELYWPLAGDQAKTAIMGTSPAAPSTAGQGAWKPPEGGLDDLDGEEWPIMWTKEVGQGKVFGTILGHNFFTFNDPLFRIILLRAMAWTMNESFGPFKPLVTLHPDM